MLETPQVACFISPAARTKPTAAVPDEWVDLKSSVGPRKRILERYRAWEDSGITGLERPLK